MKSLLTIEGKKYLQELLREGDSFTLKGLCQPLELIQKTAILHVAEAGHTLNIITSPEQAAATNMYQLFFDRETLNRLTIRSDDTYPLNTIIQRLLAAGFISAWRGDDAPPPPPPANRIPQPKGVSDAYHADFVESFNKCDENFAIGDLCRNMKRGTSWSDKHAQTWLKGLIEAEVIEPRGKTPRLTYRKLTTA